MLAFSAQACQLLQTFGVTVRLWLSELAKKNDLGVFGEITQIV